MAFEDGCEFLYSLFLILTVPHNSSLAQILREDEHYVVGLAQPALHLFSGSSTQGGVASINRPNSGSSASIAVFMSQAIWR